MPNKTYKWTVEITVDPIWVADGFNLTEDRLLDILQQELGFVCSHEVGGKVLKAPDPKQIRAEQGYKEEGYKPYLDEGEEE